MSSQKFCVDQIDHVELFVPDRYKAAEWYEQVLSLKILRRYEFWAEEGGPLMISSDEGSTKLALFPGEPTGSSGSGFCRVAFRVDGPGFIAFLDRLDSFPVFDEKGQQVMREYAVDHGKAFSIYFCDPHGYHYELTTYDYDHVAKNL